ncbi:hypothetical protein K469DRAFT_747146 [Zopfia rhizophila CBS 207.26]|uniref:Uncharacterized protein n=1 Tax=Zopfia rhizophila CBS 207.26 TaxID=1314779 RepID=A0A6A6ELF5_9PEZI|nr:hypothetical protein K469DRAFT_747146 [Zopfia rhizophila CBS 207.26]
MSMIAGETASTARAASEDMQESEGRFGSSTNWLDSNSSHGQRHSAACPVTASKLLRKTSQRKGLSIPSLLAAARKSTIPSFTNSKAAVNSGYEAQVRLVDTDIKSRVSEISPHATQVDSNFSRRGSPYGSYSTALESPEAHEKKADPQPQDGGSLQEISTLPSNEPSTEGPSTQSSQSPLLPEDTYGDIQPSTACKGTTPQPHGRLISPNRHSGRDQIAHDASQPTSAVDLGLYQQASSDRDPGNVSSAFSDVTETKMCGLVRRTGRKLKRGVGRIICLPIFCRGEGVKRVKLRQPIDSEMTEPTPVGKPARAEDARNVEEQVQVAPDFEPSQGSPCGITMGTLQSIPFEDGVKLIQQRPEAGRMIFSPKPQDVSMFALNGTWMDKGSYLAITDSLRRINRRNTLNIVSGITQSERKFSEVPNHSDLYIIHSDGHQTFLHELESEVEYIQVVYPPIKLHMPKRVPLPRLKDRVKQLTSESKVEVYLPSDFTTSFTIRERCADAPYSSGALPVEREGPASLASPSSTNAVVGKYVPTLYTDEKGLVPSEAAPEVRQQNLESIAASHTPDVTDVLSELLSLRSKETVDTPTLHKRIVQFRSTKLIENYNPLKHPLVTISNLLAAQNDICRLFELWKDATVELRDVTSVLREGCHVFPEQETQAERHVLALGSLMRKAIRKCRQYGEEAEMLHQAALLRPRKGKEKATEDLWGHSEYTYVGWGDFNGDIPKGPDLDHLWGEFEITDRCIQMLRKARKRQQNKKEGEDGVADAEIVNPFWEPNFAPTPGLPNHSDRAGPVGVIQGCLVQLPKEDARGPPPDSNEGDKDKWTGSFHPVSQSSEPTEAQILPRKENGSPKAVLHFKPSTESFSSAPNYPKYTPQIISTNHYWESDLLHRTKEDESL